MVDKFPLRSLLLGCALLFLLPGAAFSFPILQLDILGGAYDWSTKTIVAQSDPVKLYAYLNPTGRATLSDSSSFLFSGTGVDVTGDMVYGIPTLETNLVNERRRDDADANKFEPYSHDPKSALTRVSEAGALLLFGTGLVGFVGYRRVRRMQ